jgi:hypothetical protein
MHGIIPVALTLAGSPGVWGYGAKSCRSAYRLSKRPVGWLYGGIGLRVVLSPAQPPP